ncbi:peptidylprolyl isomerase [Flavobacterium rakeshii]|uniref:Periplasmic chaperone PpiD n=1 Tax=Flavobacterium rakeshii TaxID=1038845 RepID=A0A6N8HAT4_9FLAO|nr:peptidylprolyl isomerase [Flavobacterium rakeshii]MEE1897784.1 peptidylprolyl isomerase [Flavobacterium rakeshii]MUV02675.1 peptidylprolyl isomerase [Flavobacterium rakeshii]
MAVLSKIRERSLILILVIGFCLFAFVIGDVIKSGGFGVTRNVGSVNGTDIPVQEFLEKVNELESRQPGISPTQASNSVWSQEVDRVLFGERFEQAGLRVGKDHVISMYAQNPQIAQNPQFLNAAGQFDKAKFNEFLVNMKTTNPEMWNSMERNTPAVEASAMRQIYTAMVKSGYVATNNDAKARYEAENNKVTFDYVYVPFSSINDDEITVSDDEIIAYMKKNEKKYKSQPTRSIEYVKIEDKASAEDELEIRDRINSLLKSRVEYRDGKNDTLPGFKDMKLEDVPAFVTSNSDIKYDSTYVVKKNLPKDHADDIFDLAKGDVFGPYVENGYYKVTRMLDKKEGGSVKASHILIAYKGAMRAAPTVELTKEEAKAKADDLLKQIKADSSKFGVLAAQNSDDPGSKNNGGTYDNVTPGQMVPAFDEFIFNNPVGKTGVVETDFGYHVIKVDDKYEAVRVATLALEIRPSDKTGDDTYAKASQFELDAAQKPFEEVAKAANVNVVNVAKLLPSDEAIQGLGAQRGVVLWAFSKDSEVGDVKRFDISDGYVIARIKDVNESGLMPVEEARLAVAPTIRNEKKAEQIKTKMTGDTLDAVSQASGAKVTTAENVTLGSAMVPTVGVEPKVVGSAFALEAGKTSGLIVGKSGVFKIATKTVEKAAELPNYNSYLARVEKQEKTAAASRISPALKENADIEDNRVKM